MKIYIAGGGYRPWLEQGYFDFYRLESYLTAKHTKDNFHKYKDFILDSGIFSYLNGKDISTIDWEKYTYEYAQFVKENKIKNYVEIDIDRIVGLENVEILRKKLEKEVGWKPMPVWHMNRGYDKWLEIVKDYEYVCFGAFLTDGLQEKKFKYIKKFLLDAKKENCKVHGLGFTSFNWLPKLKFYSVDSSSWSIGNRFGSVCFFSKDRIKSVTKPTKNHRIIDHKKLAIHNFNEWMKFSKYADINL